MAKSVAEMTAKELYDHIKATDEAHRAWMTRHRRLLACLPEGAMYLKPKKSEPAK